jgi:hypothetical protein
MPGKGVRVKEGSMCHACNTTITHADYNCIFLEVKHCFDFIDFPFKPGKNI